jgi:hypothetical protein
MSLDRQLMEKLVEKLRQGTWEADCVEMSLTQNDVATPIRFSGHGYLRQGERGLIHYKLYPTSVMGLDTAVGPEPLGVAGKLIESSRYFRLEARTFDGTCWRVEQTLPDVGTSYIENGPYKIVGGPAQEISFSRPFGISLARFYLTLVFFAEVAIPFNATTETTHVIAGERQTGSSSLNIARFSTRFGVFTVSKEPGMVLVEVDSDAPLPSDFETRLVEALGLVLAKPLFWNVSYRLQDDTEIVRVRGVVQTTNAKFPRPVSLVDDFDMHRNVWSLFRNYLELVCTHEGEGFHPCSRHLFSVLEASAGSLTALGLALGVAVEAIVKHLFPDAGTPMAGMEKVVPDLAAYCLAWEGLPGGELGKSLSKRLPGMIGQLLNVSTKDKLHAVARERIIEQSDIQAWNELRPRLAHGVTPGTKDVQKLIDLCNKVTTLMYRLIFRGCGYEGPYRDYSTHGFPMRYYRGRPVTEEEKAVAAYFLFLKNQCRDDVARWYAGEDALKKGEY